jgi:hypothetical protein
MGQGWTLSTPEMQGPHTRAVDMPVGAVPSPGTNVVMLGGPTRIGGRLCRRCGGRGMTPFLIFYEMPCHPRPLHRINAVNKSHRLCCKSFVMYFGFLLAWRYMRNIHEGSLDAEVLGWPKARNVSKVPF